MDFFTWRFLCGKPKTPQALELHGYLEQKLKLWEGFLEALGWVSSEKNHPKKKIQRIDYPSNSTSFLWHILAHFLHQKKVAKKKKKSNQMVSDHKFKCTPNASYFFSCLEQRTLRGMILI